MEKQRVKEIFELWKNNYLKDKEEFIVDFEADDYADQCADYFIELNKQIEKEKLKK